MEPSGLVHRNGDTASPSAVPAAQVAGDAPAQHVSSSTNSLPRGRGRGPLLWGMGGTILSAVGFIAMILFEQYNSSLSELRNDLKHFNETSGEYVKRESFQKMREQLKERFKELQAATAARVQLEHELSVSEKAREETARALQQLRERLAYVEGRQTAMPNTPPTGMKK
jgi:hypothetical protein